MSEDKKDQPIIVVKKNIKHGGHHGGAWKVAYADFVTAMMAFFLVMWLVTQSDAVKKAVEGYFNDPANFAKNYKMGLVSGSAGVLPKGGPGDMKETPPPSESAEEANRREMENLAARLRKLIDDMPGLTILKKYVDLEPMGNYIEDYHILQGTKEEFVIGAIRQHLESPSPKPRPASRPE